MSAPSCPASASSPSSERMDGDEALAARINAGDHAAFVALVARDRAAIVSFVASRTRLSLDEADEITQEAMARAWAKRHMLRHGANLRSWLFRIALNHALDRLRRAQRHPQTEFVAYRHERADADLDPLALVARAEELARARTAATLALAAMSERERMVMVAHFVHGLSYREISRRTGIRVPAIKSLVHRCKERLRALPLLAQLVQGDPNDDD